jgi:hypothetical protein
VFVTFRSRTFSSYMSDFLDLLACARSFKTKDCNLKSADAIPVESRVPQRFQDQTSPRLVGCTPESLIQSLEQSSRKTSPVKQAWIYCHRSDINNTSRSQILCTNFVNETQESSIHFQPAGDCSHVMVEHKPTLVHWNVCDMHVDFSKRLVCIIVQHFSFTAVRIERTHSCRFFGSENALQSRSNPVHGPAVKESSHSAVIVVCSGNCWWRSANDDLAKTGDFESRHRRPKDPIRGREEEYLCCLCHISTKNTYLTYNAFPSSSNGLVKFKSQIHSHRTVGGFQVTEQTDQQS